MTAANADGSAAKATNKALIGNGTELFAAIFKNKMNARAGGRKGVRFATSGAGEADLVAKKGKAQVSASGSLGEAGSHRLKLKLFTKKPRGSRATGAKRKPIKPGTYKLTLTVTNEDLQTAVDKARLKVKRNKR